MELSFPGTGGYIFFHVVGNIFYYYRKILRVCFCVGGDRLFSWDETFFPEISSHSRMHCSALL